LSNLGTKPYDLTQSHSDGRGAKKSCIFISKILENTWNQARYSLCWRRYYYGLTW